MALLAAVVSLIYLSGRSLKKAKERLNTMQEKTHKAIAHTEEGAQKTFKSSKSKRTRIKRPPTTFASRVFHARKPSWTDCVTLVFVATLIATFVCGVPAWLHTEYGSRTLGLNYQEPIFNEPLKYIGIATLVFFVIRLCFILVTYYPTYSFKWTADKICFGFLSFALGWE